MYCRKGFYFYSIFDASTFFLLGDTNYDLAVLLFFKVASRRVFQGAGVILIIAGIFGKFGAFMNTIPAPILGGNALVGVAMFLSAALSYLEHVTFTSTRNSVIIGLTIFGSLVISRFYSTTPGAIETGW